MLTPCSLTPRVALSFYSWTCFPNFSLLRDEASRLQRRNVAPKCLHPFHSPIKNWNFRPKKFQQKFKNLLMKRINQAGNFFVPICGEDKQEFLFRWVFLPSISLRWKSESKIRGLLAKCTFITASRSFACSPLTWWVIISIEANREEKI